MTAYAAPPQKSGMPGWLIAIIVVVVLLVAMIAVFVVLAMVGVRRYVKVAKTAEALNSVSSIARTAASEYDANEKLCRSASHPVPTSMSLVSGKKYQSQPSDWNSDPPDTGFKCLNFEIGTPQYYQYDYKLSSPDSFEAIAHGDLDGNGVSSEFKLGGRVASGVVVIAPNVTQTNPDE